ncbi:40S ribosomal protein S2 isoform X2 [Triticum aestivum]|nr:40S ribosomal protein S2-like isoform X2 [Triticum aestivum]
MKITPVQKQTRASQRTRFKAFVGGGDSNGHVGLGVKCAKEAATAIRGTIILAKPLGGLESWPPASPRRCCSSSASMMSSLPLVDPPR